MAGGRDVLNDYPVQPAKVQRPPLRDETLARDRLLDWLAAKIHHRVVFVIAEAGYGKTTLLADFSRRTRVRTLWYRLDEEDRNWIAFVSYLIAAGREHDEGFAPITAGMLREIGPSGPTRQAVVETLLRELRSLGEHGAVLILDDFHLVDDAPEVREIAGELIARAPERVSFIVLSRRLPSVKVARLRALGEVAELGTDDLRFNGDETERLFRETYRQPLDGDVLEDLSQRTEGWAASLQLVQAAIRDRSPTETRRFIRSLSGAEGDLYDYLAEEVVGDLPEQLQDFLMKASILQSLGSSRTPGCIRPRRKGHDIAAVPGREGGPGRPPPPWQHRTAIPPARPPVPHRPPPPRHRRRRRPKPPCSGSRSCEALGMADGGASLSRCG